MRGGVPQGRVALRVIDVLARSTAWPHSIVDGQAGRRRSSASSSIADGRSERRRAEPLRTLRITPLVGRRVVGG